MTHPALSRVKHRVYARSPDGSIGRNEVHYHPWPLQSPEGGATRTESCAFAPAYEIDPEHWAVLSEAFTPPDRRTL